MLVADGSSIIIIICARHQQPSDRYVSPLQHVGCLSVSHRSFISKSREFAGSSITSPPHPAKRSTSRSSTCDLVVCKACPEDFAIGVRDETSSLVREKS